MPVCEKCLRDAPEGALFCPFCRAALLPPGSGAQQDPLVGQTVKDAYFVQQRIGGGGMGQVYLAVQVTTGRQVALKLLRASFAGDRIISQRFQREARACALLGHPNIISLIDFGQTDEGTLFMAMEYVRGRNLLRLLRDDFPLGEGRVVGLFSQILGALAEAHGTGIVHRDLKPENVMVETRPDEGDFVKVLDFGIAKLQEPGDGEGQLTQAGMVCGTPDYMSPEQASLRPLDGRSDLYSAGVMLYQVLTGYHPFGAATTMEMLEAHRVQPPPPLAERCMPGHRVSPALEAVVLRALAKDPEERFQTAEEMRRALLDAPIDPALAEGRAAARATEPLLAPGGARATPGGRAAGWTPPHAAPPRTTPMRATPPASADVPPAGRPRRLAMYVAAATVGGALAAGGGLLLRAPAPAASPVARPDSPDAGPRLVRREEPAPPAPPASPVSAPEEPVEPRPARKAARAASYPPPLEVHDFVNPGWRVSATSGEGILSVTADPAALVFLGTRALGESPKELRLRAGVYVVRLRHERRGSRECTVALGAGERKACSATFR